MVKRLAAVLGSLDEHAQVLSHALLATVVIERARTQRAIDLEVVRGQLACHAAGATRTHGSWRLEQIVLVGLPHQ